MISAESRKSDEPERSEEFDGSEQPKTSNDSERAEQSDDSEQRERSEDSKPRAQKPTSSKHRIKSWEHSPPLALVYRPGNPDLAVEEINEANGKPMDMPLIFSLNSWLIPPSEESNSYEVQLPRWRNRLHVYIDMEKRLGYTATLRLDRVGRKKNWQRHLGLNYKVLFVKGDKPVWPY